MCNCTYVYEHIKIPMAKGKIARSETAGIHGMCILLL